MPIFIAYFIPQFFDDMLSYADAVYGLRATVQDAKCVQVNIVHFETCWFMSIQASCCVVKADCREKEKEEECLSK